jgi:hypothetical protein
MCVCVCVSVCPCVRVSVHVAFRFYRLCPSLTATLTTLQVKVEKPVERKVGRIPWAAVSSGR